MARIVQTVYRRNDAKIFNTTNMTAVNTIGLNSGKALQLAEKLNKPLANYSIFYQNTRGSHWNIKGGKFFELHDKFEELYNESLLKIDELAERILTLEKLRELVAVSKSKCPVSRLYAGGTATVLLSVVLA